MGEGRVTAHLPVAWLVDLRELACPDTLGNRISARAADFKPIAGTRIQAIALPEGNREG